jgi:Holliday junction resolvase RusA-like endonuclease
MDTELAFDSFRYDNDEHWFELIVKATAFPSVNQLYGINTRSKTVYLLSHVVKFQGEIKDQIILTDPKSHCPWINNNNVYYINFTFILNHSFWSRDLDNMLKTVQDCVFNSLNVNDSRVIEHHNYKNFKPGDYEYLIMKVGLSNYPYNQFNN